MAPTIDLNSLCTDVVDCPHSTPAWQSEGIYVVRNYNIKHGELDFSDASFVDEKTYMQRTQRAVPEEGDLIISREAPMGEVCIIPNGIKCCLGQRVVLLKVNKNICNPAYLTFAILSDYVQKQISVVDKTGSIVSNLNIPDLKNLKIPYFEKPEQDKIAFVLSSVAKKIRLNKQIIELLEQTAKMLYDYWFVQFDFPNAEGKPYRASGGEMVYNKQLKREIPKGWSVNALSDVVNNITEGTKPGQHLSGMYYSPLEVIPIRRMSFFGGQPYESANSSLLLYKENDILLGAMRVHFHRVCISAQDGITRSTSIVMRPKKKEMLPYLYQVVNADETIAYAVKLSGKSQQPYVNWEGELEAYSFAMPPDELVLQYSEKIFPMIETVKSTEHENYELTALRDFLLPLLMNGQVRVCG